MPLLIPLLPCKFSVTPNGPYYAHNGRSKPSTRGPHHVVDIRLKGCLFNMFPSISRSFLQCRGSKHTCKKCFLRFFIIFTKNTFLSFYFIFWNIFHFLVVNFFILLNYCIKQHLSDEFNMTAI